MNTMILEAFSDYLKRNNPPSTTQAAKKPLPSRQLLEGWLHSYLRNQVTVADVASYQLCRSIQMEFTLIGWQGKQWVAATSDSGQRLWTTLQHYADSYDQWQFARWMHTTQASDFVQTL
ncbi:MAG: hypothetical protein QE263_04725 [Vampirovibrionales bacterium]|nr:hypothetical protein [Vampirovibrionales bacterium]